MQLGFVGLGRMGGNMVHRLARGGHEVVVFNRSPGPVQEAVRNGCIGSTSLQDLVSGARGEPVPLRSSGPDDDPEFLRYLDRVIRDNREAGNGA